MVVLQQYHKGADISGGAAIATLRVLQKHSHVVLFQKIALHVVISFGVDGSRKKKTCGAEKVPQ